MLFTISGFPCSQAHQPSFTSAFSLITCWPHNCWWFFPIHFYFENHGNILSPNALANIFPFFFFFWFCKLGALSVFLCRFWKFQKLPPSSQTHPLLHLLWAHWGRNIFFLWLNNNFMGQVLLSPLYFRWSTWGWVI